MNYRYQMGLTFLIVLIIFIGLAVRFYLIIGRRVSKGERELFWKASKFVFPTAIACMTFINTIYGWFNLDQSEYADMYTNVYLYFLICINSIINACDSYKDYKDKENEIRKNILS